MEEKTIAEVLEEILEILKELKEPEEPKTFSEILLSPRTLELS